MLLIQNQKIIDPFEVADSWLRVVTIENSLTKLIHLALFQRPDVLLVKISNVDEIQSFEFTLARMAVRITKERMALAFKDSSDVTINEMNNLLKTGIPCFWFSEEMKAQQILMVLKNYAKLHQIPLNERYSGPKGLVRTKSLGKEDQEFDKYLRKVVLKKCQQEFGKETCGVSLDKYMGISLRQLKRSFRRLYGLELDDVWAYYRQLFESEIRSSSTAIYVNRA